MILTLPILDSENKEHTNFNSIVQLITYPQLVSDEVRGRGMRCDEAPIL